MADNDTTAGLVVASIMAVREADPDEAQRLLTSLYEDATPADIAYVLTRFAVLSSSLVNAYAEASGKSPEDVLTLLGAIAAAEATP